MKVIVHVDDDSSTHDMVFIGRTIGYLLNNRPDGIGGLVYGETEYETSWIKNKSSYSIWGRKQFGQT